MRSFGIGIFIAIVAVVAAAGCQCEEKTTPERDAPDETGPTSTSVEIVEFTEEDLSGSTGHLIVEAVENFAPVKLEGSSGKVYAIGHCNKKWPVPVGNYTVKIKPGQYPEVELGRVTVEEGQVARAKVTGFGWMNVEAVENFDPVKLTDSSGKEYVLGHCNKKWLAPVGSYDLRVKPGQYPEVELGRVTVEEGQVARAKVTGFGWVNVEAVENFDPVKLTDSSGKEYVLGHCNKKWLAPVGSYAATVKGKKIGRRITVSEGGTSKVQSGM